MLKVGGSGINIVIIPELLETLLYSSIEVPLTIVREGKENIAGLELHLKPGMKLKLQYIYARELISRGLAQVDVESLPGVQALRKMCWNEEKSEGLLPLEEGFYVKLRLYVAHLRSEVERGNNTKEAELRLVRTAVSDLISLRLNKIVKLAVSSKHVDREKMKNMTFEEQVLYSQLCNVISSWTDSMKKLVGVV